MTNWLSKLIAWCAIFFLCLGTVFKIGLICHKKIDEEVEEE